MMRITCKSLGSIPTGLATDGRRTVPAILWRWLVLYVIAPLCLAGMAVGSGVVLISPFLLLTSYTPLGQSLIAASAFALIYFLVYILAGFSLAAVLLDILRTRRIPIDDLMFAGGFTVMSWFAITLSLELAFTLL